LIFVPASQVEKLVVIQGIVASVKTPRDKVLCSQSEDSLGPGCARQVKQVLKKQTASFRRMIGRGSQGGAEVQQL
jgi:hypothetical protein